MPETTTVEPAISDLRAMLTASAAGEDVDATPAPGTADKADGVTAPASEPDPKTQDKDRDETGKFKAAKKDEAAEDAPGVAKRIGKALQAQRLAEQRAEELEAELAKHRESRPAEAKTAPPAKATAVSDIAKPLAKDFDTYEAFNEALVDWKLAAKSAADAKTASDRRAAEANAAAGAAYLERVEAAKTVHPDFDEVMESAATLPISEAMHVTMIESERGPEIAYHLAMHPDEATRIAKLSPLAAARELGKIEAALTSPKTAKPAAAKPLPKPPAQAGGSHAPSDVDLNDDKLSVSAFKREFMKRYKAS